MKLRRWELEDELKGLVEWQAEDRAALADETGALRPCAALSRERLDEYVAEALARGLRPVSVFAHLGHVKAMFAGWALERFAARGWAIKAPSWPRMRGRGQQGVRYRRPPEALREATLAWYARQEREDPAVWVAASLMLQFAMRNGDVAALRWEAFQPRQDGAVVLVYVPRKTSRSSGREVRVALPAAFFERLKAAPGRPAPMRASFPFARPFFKDFFPFFKIVPFILALFRKEGEKRQGCSTVGVLL